jgi:hypothetical protein
LSRPAIMILQPSIFMRIAVAKVRFIARRKATRRSNCEAMFSAINCASISGRLISRILIAISFLNLLRRLLRILSTSSPLRPIMIPWLGCEDVDLSFLRSSLLLRSSKSKLFQAIFDEVLDIKILFKSLCVTFLCVPPRIPILIDAQTKANRVNLLSHNFSLSWPIQRRW